MFFQCQPSLSARSFELQVCFTCSPRIFCSITICICNSTLYQLPKKVMKYTTKSTGPKQIHDLFAILAVSKKVTVREHPPYFHNHLPQVPKTSASAVRFSRCFFQGWKLCQATRPVSTPWGSPHGEYRTGRQPRLLGQGTKP